MAKRIFVLFTITMLLCLFQAQAQEKKQPPQYRQEPSPVSIHKITPHIYEIRGGSGANCAIITGEKEVYLIDAKMTEQSAGDVIRAIKSVTDKPVSRLLLTHSDGDHVNGIPGLPVNLEIIGHKNCSEEIKKANKTGPVKLPLPDVTFSEQLNLFLDGLEINLIYFGPAHTSGDIIIYVPQDRVAIIGDTFFKGMDPLIHRHKNGSYRGFIHMLQKLVELNADVYMSGHAEPVKAMELEELRNSMIQKAGNVEKMISEGKTLDEVKKAFNIAPGPWPSLVENIYLELTR